MARSMEASPSLVYGARLLSGFGVETPSRVQIPPPPRLWCHSTSPEPGSRKGIRAPCILRTFVRYVCTFLQCRLSQGPTLAGSCGRGHTGRQRGHLLEVGSSAVKRVVRRLATVVVAVGLAIGAGIAPASADTSWGYVVKPDPKTSVDR